ncbi:hypothetical protein UB31_35380 [Bradyrhizobium sp. LTSP849]|uniref:hypothetical protein n=1 Tax=Bradyrhizobium sp. LTSP849 TaxID=1615890 RepID=UPI0005D24DDE|nr:hypothetical protein [Bradyrhizobium sp. LTSP849]KJC37501.1 hypothetical protein UB31_35380 [Bradyrhizobium sp. LTSP849]
MTLGLIPEIRPANVVSFLENGAACVIFFPYAPELTEYEWEKIDAARRVRFFLYACSDAQVPPGGSGVGGSFEDYYPVTSVRSAVNRSTYMRAEILPVQKRSRQGLIEALMSLAAKVCGDDHRCALLGVTDRPSLVDDYALCRPHPRLKFRPNLRTRQTTSDRDGPVGGSAHAVR